MSYERTPFNTGHHDLGPPPFGEVNPPPFSEIAPPAFGDYGPPEVEGLLTLDIEGLDNSILVSPVASGITFDLVAARHLELTRTLRRSPTYRTSYRVLQNSVLKQKRLRITHAV